MRKRRHNLRKLDRRNRRTKNSRLALKRKRRLNAAWMDYTANVNKNKADLHNSSIKKGWLFSDNITQFIKLISYRLLCDWQRELTAAVHMGHHPIRSVVRSDGLNHSWYRVACTFYVSTFVSAHKRYRLYSILDTDKRQQSRRTKVIIISTTAQFLSIVV